MTGSGASVNGYVSITNTLPTTYLLPGTTTKDEATKKTKRRSKEKPEIATSDPDNDGKISEADSATQLTSSLSSKCTTTVVADALTTTTKLAPK